MSKEKLQKPPVPYPKVPPDMDRKIGYEPPPPNHRPPGLPPPPPPTPKPEKKPS
jgi:hypothetical protein